MSIPYSITVFNNSNRQGVFCLYQEGQNPQEKSLAWLTKSAVPRDHVQFQWHQDYSFVQDDSGALVPGVVFRSAQTVPTQLDHENMITLTQEGGRSEFKYLRNGELNMLTITLDQTIKPNQVSAGIGISGSPILVSQGMPNTALFFRPQSRFKMAFGNFREGEVLDMNQLFNSVPIEFSSGVFNYKVTYNPDGTWSAHPE